MFLFQQNIKEVLIYFKYLHQHCYVKEIEYLEKSIYLKIEARKQEIKNYLQYCLKH